MQLSCGTCKTQIPAPMKSVTSTMQGADRLQISCSAASLLIAQCCTSSTTSAGRDVANLPGPFKTHLQGCEIAERAQRGRPPAAQQPRLRSSCQVDQRCQRCYLQVPTAEYRICSDKRHLGRFDITGPCLRREAGRSEGLRNLEILQGELGAANSWILAPQNTPGCLLAESRQPPAT